MLYRAVVVKGLSLFVLSILSTSSAAVEWTADADPTACFKYRKYPLGWFRDKPAFLKDGTLISTHPSQTGGGSYNASGDPLFWLDQEGRTLDTIALRASSNPVLTPDGNTVLVGENNYYHYVHWIKLDYEAHKFIPDPNRVQTGKAFGTWEPVFTKSGLVVWGGFDTVGPMGNIRSIDAAFWMKSGQLAYPPTEVGPFGYLWSRPALLSDQETVVQGTRGPVVVWLRAGRPIGSFKLQGPGRIALLSLTADINQLDQVPVATMESRPVALDNNEVVLAGTDGFLYWVDANRKLLHKHDTGTAITEDLVKLSDNSIGVYGKDGFFRVIDRRGEKWKYQLGFMQNPPAVWEDDIVVAGTDAGQVLFLKDGQAIYTFQAPQAANRWNTRFLGGIALSPNGDILVGAETGSDSYIFRRTEHCPYGKKKQRYE